MVNIKINNIRNEKIIKYNQIEITLINILTFINLINMIIIIKMAKIIKDIIKIKKQEHQIIIEMTVMKGRGNYLCNKLLILKQILILKENELLNLQNL